MEIISLRITGNDLRSIYPYLEKMFADIHIKQTSDVHLFINTKLHKSTRLHVSTFLTITFTDPETCLVDGVVEGRFSRTGKASIKALVERKGEVIDIIRLLCNNLGWTLSIKKHISGEVEDGHHNESRLPPPHAIAAMLKADTD
jgi:hypothetical protein